MLKIAHQILYFHCTITANNGNTLKLIRSQIITTTQNDPILLNFLDKNRFAITWILLQIIMYSHIVKLVAD